MQEKAASVINMYSMYENHWNGIKTRHYLVHNYLTFWLLANNLEDIITGAAAAGAFSWNTFQKHTKEGIYIHAAVYIIIMAHIFFWG